MGMRIEGHLRTDEAGKSSQRKIYVCWLPAGETEANSKWVDKLFDRLRIVRQDNSRVPISAVRPAGEAGAAMATEQQACREDITDFVFVVTSTQIAQHENLVNSDRNSDLKWVLDLQSAHDASAPRVWFVPLESMAPMWFQFPPLTSPEKFLNEYLWHLPAASLVTAGHYPGDDFEVAGFSTESTVPQDLDKVRAALMAHGAKPCQVCP